MPDEKPGFTPDNLPVLWNSPPKVWETGESPDQTRVPGTRRLWAAGALAVAVLLGSVTALALQEPPTENSARERTARTTGAEEAIAPTVAPAAPVGKSGLSSPQPTASKSEASSDSQQGGAKPEPEPEPEPSKPTSPSKKPPSSSKPSTSSWKSIQAVNYPDRYWHLRSGAIQLDRVSSRSGGETREDSTFQVVSGLSDSSCYSFRMEDGRYARHQNFRLRVDRNDGSKLFQQDATFCPRRSFNSDAIMLESVNYPGRFLRHRDFALRLDPMENSRLYWSDTAFRLVDGLA
ncbi:AbfB domain-containing protein [Streptomyces acidicola]|uniref:AbfB domain-containing protein n=1 Tax=Streptomyces acidicola TaxID=2596892 RepID=UPI003792298B